MDLNDPPTAVGGIPGSEGVPQKSRIVLGEDQYRNAVASGRLDMNKRRTMEVPRLTRRYRVTVLTFSKRGSTFKTNRLRIWFSIPPTAVGGSFKSTLFTGTLCLN